MPENVLHGKSDLVEETPELHSLGEVEGAITPDLSQGRVFTLTAKGNITIKKPINWPKEVTYVEFVITQNGSGGHTITLETGWEGSEPVFSKSPNAVNAFQVVSRDSGITWKGIGTPEFVERNKQLYPTAWPIYKGTTNSETENKPVVAEPFPRSVINTNLALTSGTPLGCLLTVPPHQVITGVALGVKTTEATPANRTHLWAVLTDASGKVLRRTPDYTSSTNNPLNSNTRRGLLFETAYEAGPEWTNLYVLICEVMSSTAAAAIAIKTTEAMTLEGAPVLSVTGPVSQTTAPTLETVWTLTPTFNMPWLALV